MGGITIELFPDVCQRAVDNFVCLCTGEARREHDEKPLRYIGSNVHKVKSKWIEAGDITEFSGTGGDSIYGKEFLVEETRMKHTGTFYYILLIIPNKITTSTKQYRSWCSFYCTK